MADEQAESDQDQRYYYAPAVGTRHFKYFTCAKCGTVNPDYLTFGVGFGPSSRNYCLGHIPLIVRVRMWIRERLGQA